MRSLNVADTAIDMVAQVAPFQPNYTVVVLNPTGSQLVLQSSDAAGSGFGTLATVPAGQAQNVTIDKQYVKVSTAATLVLLGN